VSEAKQEFLRLLTEQGLPERSWYTTTETARLLGVQTAYIKRLCATWEPMGTPGRNPKGLEAYKLPGEGGHWRIRSHAIISWLEDNHTYKRIGI